VTLRLGGTEGVPGTLGKVAGAGAAAGVESARLLPMFAPG
jgi:hypothetical protein